jgi:hypothetical protein
MDEDYILGLVLFLSLILCGACVLWATWRETRRNRNNALPLYDTV